MSRPLGTYQHLAVFHSTTDQMLDAVVPFLRPLHGGPRTTMLAVDRSTAAAIQERIGGSGDLAVLDPEEIFRSPHHALTAYQEIALAGQDAGTPGVRMLTRPPHGATPAEWAAWAAFEHSCNSILAEDAFELMCLYDVTTLPAPVLQLGRESHPLLSNGGHVTANQGYDVNHSATSPDGFSDPLELTEPSLTLEPVLSPAQARTAIRGFLENGAAGAGLAAQDLTSAVSEVVQNALQHGRPPVRLQLWVTQERLLCTVIDHGPGIARPLPRLNDPPPDLSLGTAAGLWLARRLMDSFTVRRDAGGFTVVMGIGIDG